MLYLYSNPWLKKLYQYHHLYDMPSLPRTYNQTHTHDWKQRHIPQVVEHSAVKVWILLHGELILHAGCICSLVYFPFQPVVQNWSNKGCGMCCPVCGKVRIKDLLLLIGKSSLFGNRGFLLKKKDVAMTICLTSNSQWYKNECAREASLNKANFPLKAKKYWKWECVLLSFPFIACYPIRFESVRSHWVLHAAITQWNDPVLSAYAAPCLRGQCKLLHSSPWNCKSCNAYNQIHTGNYLTYTYTGKVQQLYNT